MKRANTMSTITVELTIKVKTKFTSSNAENTKWIHLTTDVKFSHSSCLAWCVVMAWQLSSLLFMATKASALWAPPSTIACCFGAPPSCTEIFTIGVIQFPPQDALELHAPLSLARAASSLPTVSYLLGFLAMIKCSI